MPDAANIKPLTAFRFFAALWVVLYHYWPKLDVGFVPAIAAKGYLGVEAFFILSGFILCHVYLRGFGEGRFQYGDFLWNRLARVYPLHLATLVGIGAMAIVDRTPTPKPSEPSRQTILPETPIHPTPPLTRTTASPHTPLPASHQ